MLSLFQFRQRRADAGAALAAALAVAMFGYAGAANAQDSSTFKEQFKLIKAPDAVAKLGADLFGDQVNLYSGGLAFTQTDVSLPGNNSLSVAMGRRLSAGRYAYGGHPFGRWQMDIPHLHGVFGYPNIYGTINWPSTSGNGNRCSEFGAPPEMRGLQGESYWAAKEYWQGSHMYVPGSGDQQLLKRVAENTVAPAAMTVDGVTVSSFPVVTSAKWALGCIALANPDSAAHRLGQGFMAVAPDGTRYRFDWMVTYRVATLRKSSDVPIGIVAEGTVAPETGITEPPLEIIMGAALPTVEVRLLPTKVIDRFGNWVSYTYDPVRQSNLTKIESSDGRKLSIAYVVDANGDSNLIKSVSDGTRTWQYAYHGSGMMSNLDQVTLPDNSRWQFPDFDGLLSDPQFSREPNYCGEHQRPVSGSLTGSIVHPSGATGTFTLTPTEHGRSDVRRDCFDKVLTTPIFYHTNSLTNKHISGPGLTPMDWTYEYGPGNGSFWPCDNCVTTATVSVTDPEGQTTRYTYGNRYFESEGKLERTEIGWDGATALRTTDITYRAAGAGPYLSQDGTSDELDGDGGSDLRVRPEEKRVTTQQGVQFTWTANAFDTFARPTQVTRASGLGDSRSETTTYEDNLSKWVIGQVKQVTGGDGKIMVQNVYDASTANLESVRNFGKLQRAMTYNADGTLYTQKDDKGQTTTFSDYKRGIARLVKHPDLRTETAVVNDIGKITSLSNEVNATWVFGYDAMGRLASLSHPTTDTVAWNATTISFGPSAAAYGDLPAGHWRQTITTGNAQTTMYYDAFWRPVYTEKMDIAAPSTTQRVTKYGYDAGGHTVFESYPKRSLGEISAGVRSNYDALGRLTQTLADSELGVLSISHDYVSGFVKRSTDARGHATETSFQAFDVPVETAIRAISAPLGVSVAIARDNYGKTESITRSGDGKSATRRYVYDQYQRLCKTIEPETGATVQDYDLANNVAWRATGLSLLSPLTCDTTSVTAAQKMSFSYDARNRLLNTTFGDSSPTITRTYTDDGLPYTVSADNSVWTSTYNKRRLLERESLVYGGKTYNIDRKYDANASLLQLKYPVTGLAVDYNPNALGEARQAGSYASNVTYHPNGAIAGFTYGNGIVHTLAQNLRGLPQQSTDAGIISDQYAYDENANVAAITDLHAGTTSRTMGYDELDRLKTVSAPAMWGNAAYTYDALDNLTATSIGSGATARSTVHTINPTTNRIDSITNGPATYNFSYLYDAQGNITKRGTQSYVFDQGNRLRSAAGRASYAYDGLGHRFSVVGTDGVNRIQVYSQDGQLLYVAPSGGTGTHYIYLHKHQIAEVLQ